MKTVDTFTANIYLGLKEGYKGIQHEVYEVEEKVLEYCNDVGLAVTVTPLRFVYTGGIEVGCVIGLINYPRFPSTIEEIEEHAFTIAKELVKTFKQERCSIVCSDRTYLIEKEIDPLTK